VQTSHLSSGNQHDPKTWVSMWSANKHPRGRLSSACLHRKACQSFVESAQCVSGIPSSTSLLAINLSDSSSIASPHPMRVRMIASTAASRVSFLRLCVLKKSISDCSASIIHVRTLVRGFRKYHFLAFGPFRYMYFFRLRVLRFVYRAIFHARGHRGPRPAHPAHCRSIKESFVVAVAS
jgi:hypothetical protein